MAPRTDRHRVLLNRPPNATLLAAVNLYGAAVDEILAVDDGSDVQWVPHRPRRLRPRHPRDDTGTLAEHRDYTAYGEISRFNPDGTPDTTALDFVFAFTGREWDDDIHLANHRARWYRPPRRPVHQPGSRPASPAATRTSTATPATTR